MKQLLIDLGAVKTEDEKIYVNGVRFVPAKQSVIDDFRNKGIYDIYLKACKRELEKEEKIIGRTTFRVSNKLVTEIFESIKMDM